MNRFRSARPDILYFDDSLRTGLRKCPGFTLVASLLTTQISLIYLILVGWFARFRSSRRDISVYSYHRKSSFGILLWMMAALVIVEAGFLHVVISIWSHAAAWAFTGLNIYALVWMVGHFHAARLQPVIVDAAYIHLRTGIAWQGRISLSNLAEIRKPKQAVSKFPEYVNASLMGYPDIAVILEEPDNLEEMFARKRTAGIIGISLDDPGAFTEDVKGRANWESRLQRNYLKTVEDKRARGMVS